MHYILPPILELRKLRPERVTFPLVPTPCVMCVCMVVVGGAGLLPRGPGGHPRAQSGRPTTQEPCVGSIRVPQAWVGILAALQRRATPSLIHHRSSLGVTRERGS